MSIDARSYDNGGPCKCCGRKPVMSTPAAAESDEPTCCGEPMVHNSFAGEYECSSAYFYLLDEKIVEDYGRGIRADEGKLSAHDAEVLAHWRGSWVPDGWDAGPPGVHPQGGAR